MSKRTRITGKGRGKRFFALPHDVIKDERYTCLSAMAVKLLIDIGGQYNGYNNGHLMATWSFLHEKRGWKSKDSLYKARQELVEAGLIMITRFGGKNRATLYGLTFENIDEGKVKLHVKTTKVPHGAWRKSDEAKVNAYFH